MDNENKPTIHVVGAVIVDAQGLILCARRRMNRSNGGFWEFPGGKVELGESEQVALRREIFEEMEIDIEVGERIEETLHAYETVWVRLITYYALIRSGEIHLKDHDHMLWLAPADLETITWAPADLPTVRALQK